ncbi:MAG: hypothetical protein KAS32_10340 [Candidatus Peribacteraceae bacterium]|nr:hypothetical protein [Candidatus Peribacteraceae bacterium]
MDITQIKSLITKSRILTDAERAYWSASLSKMNGGQMQRLESILQKAEQIPWTQHIQQFFSIITTAAEKVA